MDAREGSLRSVTAFAPCPHSPPHPNPPDAGRGGRRAGGEGCRRTPRPALSRPRLQGERRERKRRRVLQDASNPLNSVPLSPRAGRGGRENAAEGCRRTPRLALSRPRLQGERRERKRRRVLQNASNPSEFCSPLPACGERVRVRGTVRSRVQPCPARARCPWWRTTKPAQCKARRRRLRATSGCGAGTRRRASSRCGRSATAAPRCGARAGDRRAGARGRRASGRGCCSIGSTTCGTSARALARRARPARSSRIASSTAPGALRYLVARRRRPDAGDGGAARRVAAARPPGRVTCASSARRTCSRCRPRSSISSRPAAPTFAISPFDELRRLQFDLETTGLDPRPRSDLHGRGARSGRRDRGARGARRRRCRRGGADRAARGARRGAPIPT